MLQPTEVDNLREVHWAEFDTGGCRLCLHSGGTDHQVEGASKVVFWVEDVEEAREWLQERRVTVGEVRSPSPGVQVAGARDPEGNIFSIESTESAVEA